MINKTIIEENFSKHAWDYDQHSKVQNFCASILIKEIGNDSFSNILDIGCGTGNYTKLLREKFPKAKIKAIDISSEMIKVAKEKKENKGIEFIVADAQEFKLEEKFDLISSNASFQWFQDLKLDLIRYKDALSKRGVILFATFGPKTFSQLHSCLEEFLNKPLAISASNFLKQEEIKRTLKGIFKEVEVREKICNQEYDSLLDLLENLKCTGTRGNGLKGEIFWTSQKIVQIEKIYRKRFSAESGKSILATYQMFFCRGVK